MSDNEARYQVPQSLLERMRKSLRECAEDLQCELDARYGGSLDNPTQARRYENDVRPIKDAMQCLDDLDREVPPAPGASLK